jgi:hypothetical protein
MAEASREVEAVIDVSKLEPYISKEQVVEPIVAHALCDWHGEGLDK